MSMVSIDYMGLPKDLGFSTDEYVWWIPFYKWTFSDGENEYSIVCRHAHKYFAKILKIASSKDAPIDNPDEAMKHQVNQCEGIEDDIDHIGLDFFDNDGEMRVVGWTDEEVIFEFHCNTAEFIHDIAKLVDSHLQKIGILYYDDFYSGAFSVNRDTEGFDSFEKQDFWLTSVLSLSDIVLLKACVLDDYDTGKMIDGLDVDLSRDVKILMTPIV